MQLGAFVQYRDIEGAKGKILGVWSVMMQVRLPEPVMDVYLSKILTISY